MFGMRGYTPNFIDEAKKARFKGNYIIQLLIFLLIFFITQMASSVVATIFMFPIMMTEMSGIDVTSPTYVTDVMEITQKILSNPIFTLSILFATVVTTVLVIIYCRFIEKRSLSSMGIVKKNALKDYIIGILIGFSMFALAVVINVLTGASEYKGFMLGGSIWMIVLFAIGFFFQGMSEEVMLRGYLMPSLSIKSPVVVAVFTNSVIFGLMHLGNPGVTVFAVINIVLFGLFMSVYMLKTGNIFGVCAIHSTWNFVQGNVFGGYVSGLECSDSVLSFTQNESGKLFNGGSFGYEGGLAVTIVLVIALAITIALKPRRDLD